MNDQSNDISNDGRGEELCGLHDSHTSPYGLAITTLITPVFDFPLNSSRLKCVVDNSRAGEIEPSPLDEIITVGKFIAAILQIFCNELFYVNELTLLSVISFLH